MKIFKLYKLFYYVFICFYRAREIDSEILPIKVNTGFRFRVSAGAPEHMWTCGFVHTIFWDKSLKISYF